MSLFNGLYEVLVKEKYVGPRSGLTAAHNLELGVGCLEGEQAVKQTIIIYLMGHCASIKRQALDGSMRRVNLRRRHLHEPGKEGRCVIGQRN